jgi:hypothetical protein
VLFEEPHAQLAGEGDDPFLALVEGDQVFLLVLGEQQVEHGVGLLEPLLAEALPRSGRLGFRSVHGSALG